MPLIARQREAAPPLLVRLRKINTASTATRRRTFLDPMHDRMALLY